MEALLADENISRSTVEMLRELGYNVKWVVEAKMEGVDDDTVYAFALSENRIIISFDDYFSQRAYIDPTCPGVVILKFKPKTTQECNDRLKQAIDEIKSLSGKIAIIHRFRVRIRTL